MDQEERERRCQRELEEILALLPPNEAAKLRKQLAELKSRSVVDDETRSWNPPSVEQCSKRH